jgi:hypothetical protein
MKKMVSDSSYKRITHLKVLWENTQPFIQIYDHDSEKITMQSLIGYSLSYQVPTPSERVCVNYGDLLQAEKQNRCEKIVKSGKKCDNCIREDNIFASQFHSVHKKDRSSISQKILKRMQKENILYIAGFFDGSTKVGTSASNRIQTRLLEQGAIHAVLMAETPDGITVRLLEDLITEELGIGQAVSIGKKIDGLLKPLMRDALQKELKIISRKVKDCISTSGITDIKEITSTWDNEYSAETCWDTIQKYPISLSSGNHDLKVKSVVGRVAALSHNSGMTLAADLNELLGITVESGKIAGDEISVQAQLF